MSDPRNEIEKFMKNLNSQLEEDKATREKYNDPNHKRETYVKLEFSLPVLQAMLLCKLIVEMEKKEGG